MNWDNETRISVGVHNTKPKFNNLEDLGIKTLEQTRINHIVHIIDNLTKDEGTKFHVKAYHKLVTLCYENDINYSSVKDLLERCENEPNVDMTYILNSIYQHYNEHAITKPLARIVDGLTPKSHNFLEESEIELQNELVLSDSTVHPMNEIGNDHHIILDLTKKVVKESYTKKLKSGTIKLKEEHILEVCPVSITEYYDENNPAYKEYSWTVVEEGEKPIKLPRQTIPKIREWLLDSGKVDIPAKVLPAISSCHKALKRASRTSKNGTEYIVQTKPLGQGFHWKENEIIVSDYEVQHWSKHEIQEAWKTFEEYLTYFTEKEQGFLIHTLKWGLFAPFSYAYKLMQNWIPWMYLQGAGRCGKTMGIGYFLIHLWFDEVVEGKHIFASERGNTEARLANLVTQTTFPRILEESEGVFDDNRQMQNMLKDCVTKREVRETQGQDGKLSYGMSAVLCTANGTLKDASDGGIRRRITRCNYSYKEQKDKNNERIFNDKWQNGFKDSPLNKLRPLAHGLAEKIMNDSSILNGEWTDITNKYLEELFEENDITPTCDYRRFQEDDEGLVDLRFEAKETLCEGIQWYINKARGKVSVQDDHGKYMKLSESEQFFDPAEYTFKVLESRMIEGMYLKDNKDGQMVHITTSFINKLYKGGILDHRLGLKEFADNFGWDYLDRSTRLGGKVTKTCFLPYDRFINWLYGDQL